jgi:Tfp pilus assembly protein PilO
MSKPEWSEKIKLALAVAAGLVLNLAVWFVVYKAQKAWEKEDASLKKLQKEVKDLDEKASKKAEKEYELDRLSRENARGRAKLPDEHEREQFMQLLASQAQRTNLVLKSTTPNFDQKPPLGGLIEQNYLRDIWSTSYEADYNGLCGFFNFLEEHYPRFVCIENFTISPKDGGMNVTGAKHSVNFDVVTYRYVAND